MYRGAILAHWSKSQSNIALSSAEAELNATVKGLSELIGLYNLIEETQKVSVNLVICTDASACKGMLLRHGTGKVKHLSVKQLWAQECVRTFDVDVQRVARESNPSDVLTHSVSHPTMEQQLSRLNISRGRLSTNEEMRLRTADRVQTARMHNMGHEDCGSRPGNE